MISALMGAARFLIGAALLMIFSFLFLCMNAFTVPAAALLYLVCKLLRWKPPRLRFYSLMLYPSWSEKPKLSFANTVARYNRRRAARAGRKQGGSLEVTRPWEARFFD